MCGIAGVVSLADFDNRQLRKAVVRMCDAQFHRGPDDEGVFVSKAGNVALGSRRLSIIDLSPAGHQPMGNEDGSLWITYNGEVYNFLELRAELLEKGHRFRSKTDTEVVLHLYEEWGEGCVTRLRGMFAFGIWDERRQRLFLARDRLGIKPLYVAVTPGTLTFASEVRGIVASGLVPRETCREALVGFLVFGSVPSPLTTVQGVRVLPPGHTLVAEVTDSGLKIGEPARYWDLPAERSDSRRYPRALAPHRTIYTELEEAVDCHLVSDAPVGLFLSGGIDSSSLAALASRRVRRLVTLNVTFEEKAFDESPFARQVAERCGADHREIRVVADDFIEEVPQFLAALDQPSDDGLNTYFVAQAARKAGLKVILSGLGGDELFLGYSHYRRLTRLEWPGKMLLRVPTWFHRFLFRSFSVAGLLPGANAWKRLGYLRDGFDAGIYAAVRGLFSPSEVRELLGAEEEDINRTLGLLSSLREGSLISRISAIEIAHYLHDQLLRDTDVMSMAHSVEVRVPFLDHRIVEAVFPLPTWRKVSHRTQKPLLVAAMGPDLPEGVASLPKRGFTFPFGPWMRQHFGSLLDLASGGGPANRRAVEAVWEGFRAGRIHWSRPWALVVLAASAR